MTSFKFHIDQYLIARQRGERLQTRVLKDTFIKGYVRWQLSQIKEADMAVMGSEGRE